MKLETITVPKTLAEERLNFGWQYTGEEERSGRSHTLKCVLARDKQMNNYKELCNLETKYFNLKNKIKHYEEPEIGLCIVLFLIFIIPGVLYLVFKNHQKNKITEYNINLSHKLKAIADEAKKYLN